METEFSYLKLEKEIGKMKKNENDKKQKEVKINLIEQENEIISNEKLNNTLGGFGCRTCNDGSGSTFRNQAVGTED